MHPALAPQLNVSQVIDDTSVPIDPMASFMAAIKEARLKIKVVKAIPKVARRAVCEEFKKILTELDVRNDLGTWKRVFSFPYIALRLPAKVVRCKRLHQVIFNNLNDVRNHINLETVLAQTTARKQGNSRTREESMIRHVVGKLSEGDIRSAARALCSSETVAAISDDVRDSLKAKHPEALPAGPQVSPIHKSLATPDLKELRQALNTFSNASSAGMDGLRPRHLKEMLSWDGDNGMALALTRFIGRVLNGTLPDFILPYFYGATLTPFLKKSGGLRPIACGLSLRRLATKIILRRFNQSINTRLLPRQLGCGVSHGCEGIIHAVRHFTELSSQQEDRCTVAVKFDFHNAFNQVNRIWLLEQVKKFLPEMFPMIFQAYGGNSYLSGNGFDIQSCLGVQQGDPAGPALFCVALKPLVDSLESEMSAWYLDDGIVVGSVEKIVSDILKVRNFERHSGLTLNTNKCEVFLCGGRPEMQEHAAHEIRCALPGVKQVQERDFEVLGSPLTDASAERLLTTKMMDLDFMCSRATLLSTQQAILLLRLSLYAPRIIYLLRTSPASRFPRLLEEFDSRLHDILQKVLNVSLDARSFEKATLPIRGGGLGIRRASDIAQAAFVSSLHASSDLVTGLLPEEYRPTYQNRVDDTRKEFMVLNPSDEYHDVDFCKQRDLDTICWRPRLDRLFSSASSSEERAAMLSAQTILACKWLETLPIPQMGTLVNDTTFKTSICLRLSIPPCREHMCTRCKAMVAASGTHGLRCQRCVGRVPRHSALNEEVRRALCSAHTPARREPIGLFNNQLQPDGITLVTWRRGRCAAWDVTVVDTLAPSYIRGTSITAGTAANIAERTKSLKYANLPNEYDFYPLAFETLGAMGTRTKEFIDDLCQRLRDSTGDARAGSYFLQRLSLELIRGNASSIMGSMLRDDGYDLSLMS